MSYSLIIDAIYKDETRIALVDKNGLVEDLEIEVNTTKKLKGNIYLARIVRIEPSIQAAFVDYGDEKHGFLPLSDVHPDYYNLPEDEKQKFIESIKAQIDEKYGNYKSTNKNDEGVDNDYKSTNKNDEGVDNEDISSENDTNVNSALESEDSIDEIPVEKNDYYKNKYKIQDVLKTGQPLLVQVVKDERGNKGAGLTTYITLAGKYCVLMPNSYGKGGISRKITSIRDRRMLRFVLKEMNLPHGTSVIIRTAGIGKSVENIRKDYDYLVKLWGKIREVAISSTIPSFIHAEDDAVTKYLRDMPNIPIKEIVAEGKDAYQTAIDFFKIYSAEDSLEIKLHNENVPIFNKYSIDDQVLGLYNKKVLLPSGGSIVIDYTEALVSIDVNSGKSTAEGEIESTAFKTNFEAATEVARQLKLRDLGGLIVIDFIDMYDPQNRQKIENHFNNLLQNDKARTQIGRISQFGLLEMSRQRIASSFFERMSEICDNCNGSGLVRSSEIVALNILRAIRNESAKPDVKAIHVYTNSGTISYMANYKKFDMVNFERKTGIFIFFHAEAGINNTGFHIKRKNSLDENEKRSLQFEAKTGKVNNQLSLEKEDIIDEAYDAIHDNSGKAGSENGEFTKNSKHEDRKFQTGSGGNVHNNIGNGNYKKDRKGGSFKKQRRYERDFNSNNGSETNSNHKGGQKHKSHIKVKDQSLVTKIFSFISGKNTSNKNNSGKNE